MQQKLLTEEQLKDALDEVKKSGRRLGRVVVEKGYVTEEKISETLARQVNAPYIDLKHYNTRREGRAVQRARAQRAAAPRRRTPTAAPRRPTT